MSFTGVPVIIVISYLMGEIYKYLFRKKKDAYKLIPIVTSMVGGLLGILIYLTNKEVMLDVRNIYDALLIGLVSGASATCSNQIIKQLFNKDSNKKESEEK